MKRTFILLLIGFYGCRPVLPLENPFTDAGAINGSESVSGGKNLHIDILDIGQGDATLVRGPNGKILLIDAGRPGEGAAVILPYFESREITRVDWIVATHYDADHIGGISEVIKGPDQTLNTDDDFLPTDALIDRGDVTDKATTTYEEYAALLPALRLEAAPGMVLNLGGGAEAEVIVVNGRYADGRSIHLNPDEENEASLGLLIRYGDFKYFTAGDLTGGGAPGGYETKDMETMAGEIIGDIDVLHAGHHGSASSSNESFLESTHPEAVMISVGADNDYGHPADAVLQRLEKIGAKVYRTDQLGSLAITSNGSGYEISPL